MTTSQRALGKCQHNHPGSYGYPARPEHPYPFCPQCGDPMVWSCPHCGAPMPDDSAELTAARFCRDCGTPYFPDAPDATDAAGDDAPPA